MSTTITSRLTEGQRSLVADEQFRHAVSKLREEFGVESFDGMRFLDLGCDGGVFSLAAYQLGADEVVSVGDAEEVSLSDRLRESEQTDRWSIQRGNVLDDAFVDELGAFDAVYCWDVVHHTGAMWDAIDNATKTVAAGGTLCLGVYNEKRGGLYDSRRAHQLKRIYSVLPPIGQDLLVYAWGGAILAYRLFAHRQPPGEYISSVDDRHGHTFWTDIREWVGRLPFEYATPEAVERHFDDAHDDFSLRRVHRTGGVSSVNTYVFDRE